MKRLLAHKYHLISISLIGVLFLVSVQIRQEKLALPLSPEHEWITAHTLLTLEIWDEAGGPQAYGFNPVYTYQGKGNKAIGSFGGVQDAKGDMYYTSYPPFCFISAYYATKLLGGPDLSSIRVYGLLTHLFCAILLYLIFIKLRNEKKDTISIAGLCAATVYLFSAGYLWGHSIIYFSDTLVQLFILLSLYYLIRLLKNDIQNSWQFYSALALITFLGAYTEWLSLFLTFYTGITLLILFFIQKNKNFIRAFFVLGISSFLALSTTIFQYSNINGWESLKEVSSSKYEERSGNQEDIEGLEVFNWENPRSWELLKGFINRNFAMAINLFGISFFFLIPVLIWRKSREKIKKFEPEIALVSLLLVSVLSHYLLFFNFNAIHNFSNLKTGLFMIMTVGVICSIVEQSITVKLKFAFAGILLFILIPRILVEKKKFDAFYSFNDFNQGMMVSAETIREHSDPDKLVLGNFFPTPAYIYRAHHNIFPIPDTSAAAHFMQYFEDHQAQFYHHNENASPVYMLELELQDGQVVTTNRIDFE